MNAPTSITTPLDAETFAKVEEMARERGISRLAFAAEAIRLATTEATDFSTYAQAGVSALERGEVHTQDEVEAWFEQRIASRRRG